jgi:hypothetical protein
MPLGRPSEEDVKRKVLGGLAEPIPTAYSLDLWDVNRALLTLNPADRPTIDEVLTMPQVCGCMRELG